MDHIYESLETIFGLKILKFFWPWIRDGKNSDLQIREKHPGSATRREKWVTKSDGGVRFSLSLEDEGHLQRD
jgi:hypothetical protein